MLDQHLLKKRGGKSAQAHSLELLFTNLPIFYRSHVIAVEAGVGLGMLLATSGMSAS